MGHSKAEVEKVAERLNRKYGVPKDVFIPMAEEGLSMGLSLRAIEITWRMHAGNGNEKFSVEDMMEITGCTREEVIKDIEELNLVEKGMAVVVDRSHH